MKQTFARTRNGYANSQLRTNYPKSTTGRNMHVCNVSMFRCSDGLTRANPPSVSRLRGSGRWSLGVPTVRQANTHTHFGCGQLALAAGVVFAVRVLRALAIFWRSERADLRDFLLCRRSSSSGRECLAIWWCSRR